MPSGMLLEVTGVSLGEAVTEIQKIAKSTLPDTIMTGFQGAAHEAVVGAGEEVRQPLGLAVVGGLLFSQMLTLFVTPVFYLYMDKLQTWLGRKKHL